MSAWCLKRFVASSFVDEFHIRALFSWEKNETLDKHSSVSNDKISVWECCHSLISSFSKWPRYQWSAEVICVHKWHHLLMFNIKYKWDALEKVLAISHNSKLICQY